MLVKSGSIVFSDYRLVANMTRLCGEDIVALRCVKPLKPLRVDSALRALSTLRGLRSSYMQFYETVSDCCDASLEDYGGALTAYSWQDFASGTG